MIYNINIGSQLLGCIFKNPSLIMNPQFPLQPDDFAPEQFHKILFLCASKAYQAGINDITEIEIDNIAKSHNAAYEILVDNRFEDFIATVRELASLDNYESYWNSIRKYSMLRQMKDAGMNVDKWFDETVDNGDRTTEFTIQEMLAEYEVLTNKLRTTYDTKYVRHEMYAGEDTEGLLEQFEQKPMMGACLTSPYQTTIYNGWNRSHLILRGARSSLGKTRLAAADLCNVGAKKMWNDEAQDFIDNPNYQGSTFFIHTEMETRINVNPIFLACISGVDNSTITKASYTKDERNRILKAGEILEDSRIRLVDMPNFTSRGLETKIKECVQADGATYGVFDYIWLNRDVSLEYQQSMGTNVRPDMAIASIAADLKQYAEAYNVGLMTMCQLSRNYEQQEFCDASCLAGAVAMQDKLDCGSVMIGAKDKPKSWKKVEAYIKKRGFGADGEDDQPNIVEHIFKARYQDTSYSKFKIWSKIDRGTMRRKDYFVTDENDELISINRTTPYGEKDFDEG